MPKDVTSALDDGVGTSDPAVRYRLECALCMFTGGGFIAPCRFTEENLNICGTGGYLPNWLALLGIFDGNRGTLSHSNFAL